MITATQSRAARAVLRWSQGDLAKRVGVTPLSIRNFESGGAMRRKNLEAIRKAFEAEGVGFVGNRAMTWLRD